MISDSSSTLTEKRSIAWRSGPISMTISTKSPPIGAGPTARSTSVSLLRNMVSNAPMMASSADTLRMSTSCCAIGGFSDSASRWRWLPIFSATALAPMLSSTRRTSASGTTRSVPGSSTSAAVCAAASRSLSQLRRKLAIEGT